MKKSTLFLVLILTFSVLVSCSNDSDSENQLVIKKVTEEVFYGGGSEVSEANFIYENNNLVKIVSKYGYNNFIYDGAKILKIENYYNSDQSAIINNFYYENDNLSYNLIGNNERINFTYSNGKLSKIEYGFLNNDLFVSQGNKQFIYSESGNVIEVSTTSNYTGTQELSKSIYQYDNKKNPFINMNKYIRLGISFEGVDGLSNNNKLTQDAYSPISATTPEKYKYEYIYNSDNYPTTIKRLTQSGTLISNLTIEYQNN